GETAALTMFPFGGALFGETSRAESKEVKETDSWLQGIEALRDEALHSKFEHSAWFIQEKSGKESWKHFSRGEETEVEREDWFFLDVLKQSPTEVRAVHTHPIAIFKLFGASSDKIIRMHQKNEPLPSLPPSIGDVGFTIVLKTMAQKESPETKFSHIVVEPGGIWEIEVDLNHPFADTIIRYDRVINALKKYLSEEEFAALLRKGANILYDPYPNPEKEPLMAEFFNIVEILHGRESYFMSSLQEWNSKYKNFVQSGIRGNLNFNYIIKAYKSFGATVSFTDYKSLGL
ncbi:MAG: hypothetical protein Q8R36_03150, partial [bacterium]|nr:hypothetical protein [bacterium]